MLNKQRIEVGVRANTDILVWHIGWVEGICCLITRNYFLFGYQISETIRKKRDQRRKLTN